MPRYDYRCRSGHSAELLRPMAVEIVHCPTCGDLAERVPFSVTAPVAQFEEMTIERPLTAAAKTYGRMSDG